MTERPELDESDEAVRKRASKRVLTWVGITGLSLMFFAGGCTFLGATFIVSLGGSYTNVLSDAVILGLLSFGFGLFLFVYGRD